MRILSCPTPRETGRVGGGEPPTDDTNTAELEERARQSWREVEISLNWDEPLQPAIDLIRAIPDEQIPLLLAEILDMYADWGSRSTPMSIALFERLDMGRILSNPKTAWSYDNYCNPLHFIASLGHDALMEHIIERAEEEQLAPTNAIGQTPLHIVAGQSRFHSVMALPYRLHDAATSGHIELSPAVQYLFRLFYGMKDALQEEEEMADLIFAASARLLEEARAIPPPDQDPEFVDLENLEDGDLIGFFTNADKRAILAFVAPEGNSFVTKPSKNGVESTVAILVAAMTAEQVEMVDQAGNTALHCAAAQGYTDIAEILLSKISHSSVGWVNREGLSALGLAREGGHVAMVELLSKQLV